jgi:hypothetical protein
LALVYVQVTVLPDSEQPDGSARADPASANAHNANKPAVAASNPTARPPAPGRPDLALLDP